MHDEVMTAVIDIECPQCGSSASIQKVTLGTYRCGECGVDFGHEDIIPG